MSWRLGADLITQRSDTIYLRPRQGSVVTEFLQALFVDEGRVQLGSWLFRNYLPFRVLPIISKATTKLTKSRRWPEVTRTGQ